jgi:hypothetical protein
MSFAPTVLVCFLYCLYTQVEKEMDLLSIFPKRLASSCLVDCGWSLSNDFLETFHRYDQAVIIGSHNNGTRGLSLLFMTMVKHSLDIVIVTTCSRIISLYGADRSVLATEKGGGTVARVVELMQMSEHAKSKVLMFGRVKNGKVHGVTNEQLGSGFNVISRDCEIPILVMKMDFEHRVVRLEVLRTTAYRENMLSVEDIRRSLSCNWTPYTALENGWEKGNQQIFQCNPTRECIQSQQHMSHCFYHWVILQCVYVLICILLLASVFRWWNIRGMGSI